jgi:hypothetical protein
MSLLNKVTSIEGVCSAIKLQESDLGNEILPYLRKNMINRKPKLRFIIILCTAAWLVCIAAFCGEASVSSCAPSEQGAHPTDKKNSAQAAEAVHHSRDKVPQGSIVHNGGFEKTNTGGEWFVEDGYLKTPPGGMKESHFSFGDERWQDYEFSLLACATKGDCELLIGTGGGDNKGYMLVLGADGNYSHKLVRFVNNSSTGKENVTVMKSIEGYINHGRSHRVRIRCEGNRLQSWLDDKPLFAITDEDKTIRGRVSIGTRNGQAQFRNFKVSTLEGKMLFDGLPTRAQDWQAVGRGKVILDDKVSLNRKHSVKLVSNLGRTGIEQGQLGLSKGLWRCTLWIRGEASSELAVCLKDGGEILAEKTLPVLSSDWRGLPIDFNVDESVNDATLQIAAGGKAAVWIDKVEFTPDPRHTSGQVAKRH